MNKICTDIHQSKKLIELGIDIGTADMYWLNRHIDLTQTKYEIFVVDKSNKHIDFFNSYAVAVEKGEIIPAWSLSALLKLLPSEFYGETIYGDTITYKVDFRKYKFTDDVDLYQIAYGSIKFDVDGQHSFKDMVNTGQKEDPIDAVYQMICLLKENNLL